MFESDKDFGFLMIDPILEIFVLNKDDLSILYHYEISFFDLDELDITNNFLYLNDHIIILNHQKIFILNKNGIIKHLENFPLYNLDFCNIKASYDESVFILYDYIKKSFISFYKIDFENNLPILIIEKPRNIKQIDFVNENEVLFLK